MIDILEKLWVPVFSVASIIIALAVKMNDVKHLSERINKFDERLNDLEKEVKKNGEDIAFIQGKMNGV
jgi:ubiquitin-protein ligase